MSLSYKFVLPPTGQADNAIVREMFDDIKVYLDSFVPSAGAAPVDARYVTLTTNATLTQERVLTAGTAIQLTDNGAGSTVVVTNTGVTSIIAGSGISISGATGAVTITNSNPTAGANTALSNLASVAINTSLLPGTDDSIDLGSAAKTWRDAHIGREVVLYENGTSNIIIVKAPSSLASYTLTLPDSAGTSGYVLQTNGSGTTSWVAQTSTTGFATRALDNLSGVAINTTLLSDTDNTDDLGTGAKNWRYLYVKSGVRFQESGVGTDTITVTAPSSISADYTLTLPTTGGTNGYVLTTNGSGTTSWTDPGTFPTGANTALSNLASVAINTTLVSDTDNTDDLGSTSIQWRTVEARSIHLGKSGAIGDLVLYPPTASNGFIDIFATNNGGARNLLITNAALAGTRQYTFPDAGADANFVMSEGAATINGQKTFGSPTLHPVGSISAPGVSFSGSGMSDNGLYVTGSSPTEALNIACRGVQILTTNSALVTIPVTLTALGTTTNDNAGTGYIGEYVSSSVAIGSPVNAGSSGAFADITSITLSAGDWDISGVWGLSKNTGVSIVGMDFGISSTSGNSTSGMAYGDNLGETADIPTGNADAFGCIPAYRVSISGSTTYYLKFTFYYSSGTPRAYGRISARRVR